MKNNILINNNIYKYCNIPLFTIKKSGRSNTKFCEHVFSKSNESHDTAFDVTSSSDTPVVAFFCKP